MCATRGQSSCSACDWPVLPAHTLTTNSNTYCTLSTCLSWDFAAALLEYLTRIDPSADVGFNRCAHMPTHTHTLVRMCTEPSGRRIGCLQMLRSDPAIVGGELGVYEFKRRAGNALIIQPNTSFFYTVCFSFCFYKSYKIY